MVEIPAPVRAKLSERQFWQFATINADGSPTANAVWADVDGGHVIVNTAVGRRKERNVRRDPRVALAMVDSADPYFWAEIRGRVVEFVEGAEADASINDLAHKYLGTDYSGRPGERRVLLRIEPVVVKFNVESGSDQPEAGAPAEGEVR